MSGERIFVVQLIQVIMNMLTIWILALVAHRLLGDGLIPSSILFPAMYFPWLVMAGRVLTETMYGLLLWISVLVLVKSLDSGKNGFTFLFGLISGIMTLLRPEGILVWALSLPLAPAIVQGRKAIVHWLLSGAGVLVCILPWAVRNRSALGEFTPFPTTSGYNLWVAVRPVGSEVWSESDEFSLATDSGRRYYIDREASRKFTELAVENFRRDGVPVVVARALQRTALAWTRFPGTGEAAGWNPGFLLLTTVHVSMLGFAVSGFVGLKTGRAWLLVFPLFVLSLSLPVSKGLTRYLLPGMPAVALLAGQGLLSFLSKIKGSKLPEVGKAAGSSAKGG